MIHEQDTFKTIHRPDHSAYTIRRIKNIPRLVVLKIPFKQICSIVSSVAWYEKSIHQEK